MRQAGDLGRWFVCPRPLKNADLRLFCFPYAGGGPQIFARWAEQLPPGVELWAASYPGRGARFNEPLLYELPELVAALGNGIRPLIDRSTLLFGHSLGALVAFELTRFLRSAKVRPPDHLIISACSAPHLLPHGRAIHKLPRGEFLSEVVALNGVPQEVLQNDELIDLLVPMLKADFAIAETYQYHPASPLEMAFTLFYGEEDDQVELPALLAWKEHSTGRVRSKRVPGDHFFLHSAEDEILILINELVKAILVGLI